MYSVSHADRFLTQLLHPPHLSASDRSQVNTLGSKPNSLKELIYAYRRHLPIFWHPHMTNKEHTFKALMTVSMWVFTAS